MRWGRVAVAAIAVLLGASAPIGSRVDAVGRLSWLSGDWVNEAHGRWTEEQWSEPRGGLMLGLGRSGKAGRAMGFEFMRIALDDNGNVVFWGSPGGSGAVPFALVEESADTVTFANPRHDFPKRISYRRDGDTLVATVTGDDPANAQSWTYRRRDDVPVTADTQGSRRD
jgi:hypothetical protein